MAGEQAVRVLNVNVGILGHIDSGKTSLAKAISNQSSTASFDKSPQSQERGITLDLGFSALLMDLPPRFAGLNFDKFQFTFVDCPGHASLIKTIIGGAQIIDIMILVIDATKGFQTQTAEGLVIGELTSDKMVVALNKIDQYPEASRTQQIEKMKIRIQKTLANTKFSSSPIVPIAANPGGSPIGVNSLIDALVETMNPPKRDENSGKFLFAIDHCFPIRGQGTVFTGTVLRGSVQVNQTVELPGLNLTKKVKSMQMFHRPVTKAIQGDRVGICVTQLDPKLLERGLAGEPGSIPTISAAVVTMNKIRFFKSSIKTKSKFHVTVGHTTIMARVFVFSQQSPLKEQKDITEFDFTKEYIYQDELQPTDEQHPEGTQFAFLEFEKPITVPTHSLVIGSRLETDIHTNTCRLAFFGKLITPIEVSDTDIWKKLHVFRPKQREGAIDRVTDAHTLIGKNLFKKETNISLFVGLKVERTLDGSIGQIEGAFGKSGKFKVYFPNGTSLKPDGNLTLHFKKYMFQKSKKIVQ